MVPVRLFAVAVAGEGADLVGQVVGGRYEVLRELGEGGMGAVYVAQHRSLNRQFAIKVLARRLVGNEQALARFKREADVVAGLRHPNIVDVMDWEILPDGSPCIVMELLEGEDLHDRIQRGRLKWNDIARIADGLLAGLSAAHRARIVHRDLKPQNVFLSLDAAGAEHVKILDFGLSKIRDGETLLTTSEGMLGTPLYMAPEQADGRAQDATLATDIWAVGAMLYEMAAGKPPFMAPTLPGLVYQICHGAPTPLRELREDADPRFCAVVDRALRRKASERFNSASELRASLSEVLASAHLRTSRSNEAKEQDPTNLWNPAEKAQPPSGGASTDWATDTLTPGDLRGKRSEATPLPVAVKREATPLPEPPLGDRVQATRAGMAVAGAPTASPRPSTETPTSLPDRGSPRRLITALLAGVLLCVGAIALVLLKKNSNNGSAHADRATAALSEVQPPNLDQETARPGEVQGLPDASTAQRGHAVLDASVAPAEIAIDLRSDPSGASVIDDAGRFLGVTPYQERRTASSRKVRLRLRLADHHDKRVEFAGDHDYSETISLRKRQPKRTPLSTDAKKPQPPTREPEAPKKKLRGVYETEL